MLAGHFGIAQFGKGSRRELPFLLLVVAAYLPDIVRLPEELLTTRHEVLSHSLPVVLVMGLALGALWLLRGGNWVGATVLAIVCCLHWPADLFTGCKPTTFGGPWLGLVSYRRPVNDLLVEGALTIGGWYFARRRGVRMGALLLAFVLAAQVAFLLSLYWDSTFIIGQREWTWKPHQSLVPQPHVLEETPCRKPGS
jgi:membrane-bound metal-dependent hydrolase YbcI (DUF457 family)